MFRGKKKSFKSALFLQIISSIGITAGSHRLWSHRAYKARFQLKVILMIMNSIAYQGPIFFWARDHRVHHKYSDTDADPHNVNRGFFFSHVGWIFKPKHPDFIAAKSKIDITDLTNDSIVMFQKKNYKILALVFCFIAPTIIPVYFWGESVKNSWFVPTLLRFVCVLNVTFSINSFAHMFGQKPYDK